VKITMVGNAHIDPVWLWRWQDGYAEVKATFRSALDRIAEFPGFIFTCAGAAFYAWIEASDPLMFAEIRRRVAEGRWVIAGGWWVQPDCNLPAAESLARHSLYGQRWFLSRFGRAARFGYNVDSFGHNAQLPQYLARSGMPFYVMMRPQEHEKELPSSLFWWEGLDGSRVLAFRIPVSYATWWGKEDPVRQTALAVAEMAERQGVDFMCFFGVGNHGGGPTRRALNAIGVLQEEDTGHEFAFGSPETYFCDVLTRPGAARIPVVRGELQHHARGCYAAQSETKALNRRAEHRVLAAEKMACLAHGLLSRPYPAARLREAWDKILFNQFHDVIGGCCIPEAYDDVREFYGQSLTASAEVLNASAQALSWAVDTALPGTAPLSRDKDWLLWEKDDLGSPVLVFNSLSWPIDARIRVNRAAASVTDDQGKPLPMQLVRASRTHEGAHDTLFIGHVPAMGWATFWIFRDREQPAVPPVPASASAPAVMENGILRVEIDPVTGYLVRLLDNRTGEEALSGPAALPIVIDESRCDTWAHDVASFRDEIGRFIAKTVRIMDAGPVVARIRVTSTYGASTLQQDIMLHAGSPVLEVTARLTWLEKQRMLKLAFPARVAEPVATWEIPGGAIERPANGEEEPGQQWIDVTGRGPVGDVRGLALLNAGKYSFDTLGSEMRMTAARSPVAADTLGVRDDDCEYLDQGIQEFRYALLPHAGSWQDGGVARAAHELNCPPIRILETYHDGPLPRSFEGIRIDSSQIVASALKKAEDNGAFILRCINTGSRAESTSIELPMLRRTWTASFGPFEIKTFRIPDDPGAAVQETGIVERREDDRAVATSP
jgi:alpha-mannosidase